MVVIDGARQGATMADRTQRAQTQPFSQVRPGGPAPQEHMEDSRSTHNQQGLGFRLVTGRSLNLTKLFGEQDAENKVPYAKWSRQIRDLIESKGVDGMELSKAMGWAIAQGRSQSFGDAKFFFRYHGYSGNSTLKQLKQSMQNLDRWKSCQNT